MNLLIKNISELLDIALKTTSFDEMLLLKIIHQWLSEEI